MTHEYRGSMKPWPRIESHRQKTLPTVAGAYRLITSDGRVGVRNRAGKPEGNEDLSPSPESRQIKTIRQQPEHYTY